MDNTSNQLIPASKLFVSPDNVRKQTANGEAQMQASILSRGVLQNLIAIPAKKPKGSFEVVAGGRRLTQVHALIASGKLSADYLVPCRVMNNVDSKSEISLMENSVREPMNPADECRAYQRIIQNDKISVEELAIRIGESVRHINGRLRLADLAPDVFNALADGTITLDVAQAFAVRPDHEIQMSVFNTLDRYHFSNAETVRTRMTAQSVKGTSPTALYVGREAYIAAGGRIVTDLFSTENNELWEDPAKLEELAAAKMQADEIELAAEHGVKKVRIFASAYVPWSAKSDMSPLAGKQIEPTPEQASRLASINEELTKYDDYEPENEAAYDAAADAIEALESERADIKESLLCYDPAEMAEATIFCTIDSDGGLSTEMVPYLPRTQSPRDRNLPGSPNGSDETKPDADNTLKPLSAALLTELAQDRTDILRLHLAHNPAMAIDLLAFILSDQRGVEDFRASVGNDSYYGPKTRIPQLQQTHEALNQSWRNSDDVRTRFDSFRAMPDEDRAGWLATRVADAAIAGQGKAGVLQSHIANLLGIETHAHWRPTEENYWSRVPAKRIHDAFEQVGGQELRDRYAGLKKGPLAQAADTIFTGSSGTVEPQIAEAAIRWVPDAMEFSPSPTIGNSEDDDGELDTDEAEDFSDDEEPPLTDEEEPGEIAA